MSESATHYRSKRSLFCSESKTSCRGTNLWCVIFTSRSASENSSSLNRACIAEMTCDYERSMNIVLDVSK